MIPQYLVKPRFSPCFNKQESNIFYQVFHLFASRCLFNLNINNYMHLLFLDLAVGAPYGGDEGRGVVYIYVGSMEGIITDVSQILQGKEIGYQLSTFGFSISGGHDLDKNGYPGTFVTARKHHIITG